jgi:hypothetical protein
LVLLAFSIARCSTRDSRPALAAPQWINGARRLPQIGAAAAVKTLLAQ